MQKPQRRIFLVTFLILNLAACAHESKKVSTLDLKDVSLPRDSTFTIIATTDFHVSLDRAEPFAFMLRKLQEESQDHQVTVSGGDLFQGSMEGNLFKGKAGVDFFNLLHMDAMALGNHDFDYGPIRPDSVIARPGEDPRGALKSRIKESNFPWVSANVVFQRTRKTFLPDHAEKLLRFKNRDLKVCILGGTTTETPKIVFPTSVRDLDFLPLASVIEKRAKFLREKRLCNFVMLVAHAGLSCKEAMPQGNPGECLIEDDHAEILHLLRKIPEHTLDAVVAGHTHLRAMEMIRGTPVIQAGAFARDISTLHFAVTDRLQFLGFAHHEVAGALDEDQLEKVSDVTAALLPYREKTKRLKENRVGCLSEDLPHTRQDQSGLANAVAQAFYEEAPHADIAIQNGGGVRNSLPKGELTYGDIFKTLPFDNEFTVIKDVPGNLVRNLLQICVTGAHYFCGFAGVKVVAAKNPPTSEQNHFTRDLNGDGKRELWEQDFTRSIEIWSRKRQKFEPLDDQKNYTIATQSYLTQGGDDQGFVYKQIEKTKIKTYYDLKMRDVFMRYFVNQSKKDGGCFNPKPYLDESPTKPARKRSLLWSSPVSPQVSQSI